VQRLSPLFTGNLPRPLSGGPHRADLRQAWPKRLRPTHQRGRGNPYAAAKGSLAAARSILPLMTSIVLAPMRRLLLAPLGLPAPFAPRRLAASPRAVALATVATTADGERSPAAPAVAQMKNRNLARPHRSLQPGALDNRCPLVRGSYWLGVGASVSPSAGSRKRTENPGAHRGFPLSAEHIPSSTRSGAEPRARASPPTRRASRGMMLLSRISTWKFRFLRIETSVHKGERVDGEERNKARKLVEFSSWRPRSVSRAHNRPDRSVDSTRPQARLIPRRGKLYSTNSSK